MSRLRDRRIQRAFTLVEVLIASAIIAFAVAAISQAVVSAQMQTYEALHDLRGMSLAESLVEEAIALPYADPEGASTPGPESGETTRALFDNVDDFHGFTEATGTLTDVAGVAYPTTFSQFSRTTTVAYGPLTIAGFTQSLNGLTVTVTVTDARGSTWTASRFVPEPAP